MTNFKSWNQGKSDQNVASKHLCWKPSPEDTFISTDLILRVILNHIEGLKSEFDLYDN